ncbi:hypothetical protein [Streptomyces sp. NPDC088137]|uniref:hypothetical protein n=1 Tax=Streptomyces sp. NPDC088137 TaxID=3365827 RepID=UPI00381CC447
MTEAEDYADAIGPIRRDMDGYLSDGAQRALGRPAGDVAQLLKAPQPLGRGRPDAEHIQVPAGRAGTAEQTLTPGRLLSLAVAVRLSLRYDT